MYNREFRNTNKLDYLKDKENHTNSKDVSKRKWGVHQDHKEENQHCKRQIENEEKSTDKIDNK